MGREMRKCGVARDAGFVSPQRGEWHRMRVLQAWGCRDGTRCEFCKSEGTHDAGFCPPALTYLRFGASWLQAPLQNSHSVPGDVPSPYITRFVPLIA